MTSDPNDRTVDPTQNVKDLMEASIKSLSERIDLEEKVIAETVKRIDIVATLRAKHFKEVRKIDQTNAAATAAQLLSAVTTLATTAQATAETLRNQVASTAASVAAQTERSLNPIVERIAQLEKSSYTGEGKQAVSDPAMAALVVEIRSLAKVKDVSAGERQGISTSAAILMGVLTAIGVLVGIAGALYAALKP